MDNEEFCAMWKVLDAFLSERTNGTRLTDLHHGGKIGFAKRVKGDLDAWCDEVAARAKAEFEHARENYEALRREVGAGFDVIEPNHFNDLHFGKIR